VGTKTQAFGVGRRESHDSSAFYARKLWAAQITSDRTIQPSPIRDEVFVKSSERMEELVDNSVALMVTSPPYHVGKEYDAEASFEDYLALLERVFAEVHRVLQPGGRAVVNVANLGRRPYIPLSHLVTERMLGIGFLMRAEVIWRKGKGASGNCAWGSWRSPANPVVRDVHEYCLCFSKGRFDRVARGRASIGRDEFLESTLSVWDIPAASAARAKHPAPFPTELPRRFIELYTYEGDLVLDPFLGSGSTAVAALEARRHFVGYEIDPGYAATARERLAAAGHP
jgi:DNA modification methylase